MKSITRKAILLLIILAVLILTNFHSAYAVSYTGSEIVSDFTGLRPVVHGMNNSGQAVGRYYTGEQDAKGSWIQHAFIWDSVKGLQDLGTFGGEYSSARDINDSGQVVGYAETPMGYWYRHAFIWDEANDLQDLLTLPGDIDSHAFGINETGQVVGSSYCRQISNGNVSGCGNRAFIWDSINGMQPLAVLDLCPPLPWYSSEAYDINNSGQVVGRACENAVLWENGSVTVISSSPVSLAYAINDLGQIIGRTEFSIEGQYIVSGWIWENGVMNELGESSGNKWIFPFDINNAGEVVGQIIDFSLDDQQRAFIWKDGVMTDLNELYTPPHGGHMTSASAINDAGQIIVRTWGGVTFLLTPIPESSITVTSPNGGEELSAGTTHAITWASTDDIDYVKIEYSADNGNSWTDIAASTENDGSYTWEVPCNPSDECLIRISDVDGDPFDESDGVFSISCELIPGDLDGDGDIDWDDFFMFLSAFGKCEGQGGYNADCDYDSDNCITFVDYQMWYGYYMNQ